MRTESISRRLAALEAKVAPNLTAVEKLLCQNAGFIAMLKSQGVDLDAFKRQGLRALPHEFKKLMADRLKVEITRRRSEHGCVASG